MTRRNTHARYQQACLTARQALQRNKRTDNIGLQYEIVISSEVKRNEKSHHL